MNDDVVNPKYDNNLPPKHTWAGDLARIDHSVMNVPDLEEGISWYRRLLGLVVSERRDGKVYLASPKSGRTVLGLSEGGTGLCYVSFRAYDSESLERLAGRLEARKVEYQRGIEDSRPGAIEALRFQLPTGHTMELLHAEDNVLSKEERCYHAGAFDVRTSHLQTRTMDVLGMSAFLQGIGFKVSNYVPTPDGEKHMIQFTRVNDYHHQLAILTGKEGLHHIALELDSKDFWEFCDHLSVEHIPAEYGPGRHFEGNLLFIYVRDPFGNRLEITGPMAHVGFDYPAHTIEHEHWYHMNMWGPQPPKTWYEEWT